MSDDNREPVFWGVGDEEILTDDPDEAIRSALDALAALPETVELVGYSRMEVHWPGYMADRFIEEILENLDEDYGGEDPSEPTDTMKQAAEAFIETVVREYVPWACEPVSRETIRVADWVRAHEPGWLE